MLRTRDENQISLGHTLSKISSYEHRDRPVVIWRRKNICKKTSPGFTHGRGRVLDVVLLGWWSLQLTLPVAGKARDAGAMARR